MQRFIFLLADSINESSPTLNIHSKRVQCLERITFVKNTLSRCCKSLPTINYDVEPADYTFRKYIKNLTKTNIKAWTRFSNDKRVVY